MLGFSHAPELFVILILALIVFGPSRLPEVGSSVGKAMREFRKATSEFEDAVMHHGEEPDEEEPFPHIPIAPDTRPEEQLTPTIDTLAQRREARQRAREVELPTQVADEPAETTSQTL